jgi:hypothetical protein
MREILMKKVRKSKLKVYLSESILKQVRPGVKKPTDKDLAVNIRAAEQKLKSAVEAASAAGLTVQGETFSLLWAGQPFIKIFRAVETEWPSQLAEKPSLLIEHLRSAQSQAAIMAHLHNTEGSDKDKLLAKGWLAVSEGLKLMQHKVIEMAQGHLQWLLASKHFYSVCVSEQ